MLILQRGRAKNPPEENTLVLGGPAHVVVCIVHQLKDVRGELFLGLGGVPILCCIFVQRRVGIGVDVLVRVDDDEGTGADPGVVVVGHEAFAEA